MADSQTELERISRRRRLIEAMQGQSMSSPIVGNDAGTSVGQGLLKVAQAYLLSQADKGLDADQSAAKAAYGSELGDAVSGFMRQRDGDPGHQLPPNQAGPEMPATPGDRRGAIIAAMTSRFPELQQVGQTEMAALAKQKPESFNNPMSVLGPDGKPILAQFGDQGGMRPVQGAQPVPEFMTAGDRVLNKADPTQVVSDFTEQWSEPFSRGGDLYQKNLQSGQIRKLDNSSKVNVNTSVSPIIQGQKAGMAEWAKLAGKTVSELAGNARQSVQTLSSLNQMEELNAAGVNSGPLATPAGFVQGIAQTMGIPIDVNKLSNSQAFESEATRAWAAMMQANGGARGLVKEESEKIASSLPSLMQSPQGRSKIISVLRMKAQQDIKDAQIASKEYSAALQSDDPAKFTFGLSQSELPTTQPRAAVPGVATPTGQTGAIPWSEYKKRLQGGK